ncbi:VWFC domain [Trinorchestia longiramus]|nr:VWFC domain [Trinorchestia longiramus]
MCTRGTITCVSEVCPVVKCNTPRHRLPRQCCSMCPANEAERRFRGPGCHFNNQTHPVGAQWHPFLPPNGFDKCVTCSCNLDDDHRPLLQCSRVECPRLSCPHSESILSPGNCCKTCPERPVVSVPAAVPGIRGDDGKVDREQERRNQLLSEGGCPVKGIIHANGDEWHPRISPGGIYKCIKCACKDGYLECHRLSCPQLSCSRKIHPPDSCCAQCVNQNLISDFSSISSSTSSSRRRPGIRRRKGDYICLHYTTPTLSVLHHTNTVCTTPHQHCLHYTTPTLSVLHHTNTVCTTPHQHCLYYTTPTLSALHHTNTTDHLWIGVNATSYPSHRVRTCLEQETQSLTYVSLRTTSLHLSTSFPPKQTLPPLHLPSTASSLQSLPPPPLHLSLKSIYPNPPLKAILSLLLSRSIPLSSFLPHTFLI